jgi:uncharacterized membrane protein YjjP (DUF1212 family)
MANLIAPWRTLRQWPTNSQLQARRNAMVACTALAQQGAERRDLEEFLRRFTHDRPLTVAGDSRRSGIV